MGACIVKKLQKCIWEISWFSRKFRDIPRNKIPYFCYYFWSRCAVQKHLALNYIWGRQTYVLEIIFCESGLFLLQKVRIYYTSTHTSLKGGAPHLQNPIKSGPDFIRYHYFMMSWDYVNLSSVIPCERHTPSSGLSNARKILQNDSLEMILAAL